MLPKKEKSRLDRLLVLKGLAGSRERAKAVIMAGLVEVDGVRTQFKDESWFLVRASNTSPAITLRFEALTRSRLLELMKDVSSLLKKYPRIDISPLLRELEEEKKGVMANPGYEQESW